MPIETINLKYKVPALRFNKPAVQPQSYRLEVRSFNNDEWTLVSDNYQTDVEGNNINSVSIDGLIDDSDYQLRFTNKLNQKVFVKDFHTAYNFSVGDSPLWMKKLYPGQTIDFYTEGLLASSLPPNFEGYLFLFEQHYRDAYAGYANAEPQNGMGFKVGQNTVNSKRYSATYMNGTRYVSLNNTHPNLESRINAAQMFHYTGDRSFSLWFWIYNEGGTGNSKPILSTGSGNNKFKISLDSGAVKVASTRNGSTTTCTSSSAITNNNWYLLEIRRNATQANNGTCFLHSDAGQIAFDNFLTGMMNSQDSDTVFVGYDNETSTVANGLLVRRIYYAVNPDLDNNTRYKLISPDDYAPRLVFERVSDQAEFVTSVSWQLKLDDSVFSTVIEPTLPAGNYRMFVRTPQGNREQRIVEVIQFDKDRTGFDIDFNTDFDAAINEFKAHFSAFHSQWGGANGGVNGNLIYANRGSKSLIFENHGDTYSGEVNGIQKPPKNDQTRGYGYTKTHDIPNDPQYGQNWKSRVGAVAVTTGYAGYGEWSTWMKIPKNTYGVAPALWFFHYQELYPTDERYQFWIDKGGKPYGGSDPYMVINHEIDVEWPSHLSMGTFAEWNQVSLTYFDPKALDTQYHISVEDASNINNYGLFRLNNPAAPNQRSSWTKVSDTWDIVSTPKMSNIKANNWIGEKSGGNGWAYSEEEYEGEEYLALLTKLDKDYADDQFHKWTIKWFKDRTEFWVDDQYIRTNRAFVPYIPGRITLGGWFPSAITANTETPWNYSPERAWAGHPANFETLNLEVNRIQFIPYDVQTAGGENEFHNETYPESGLRSFL